MRMIPVEETCDLVIVGGGISGLATALALHRKGFRSIVLEKSDTLRATGAAIGIRANGWRALEQLGVASELRQKAVPIHRAQDIVVGTGKQKEVPEIGECRCLKRTDLVTSLADALPPGTIRFRCQIVSITMDSETSYPTLHLYDGKCIQAKVLIGCDGSRSIVADFLDLKPTKLFSISAVRGLTNYPNGHTFPHEITRMRKDGILVGVVPVTDELVYWFVAERWKKPSEGKLADDPNLIKQSTLKSVDGFSTNILGMIHGADPDSLSFTHLRHRAPWDLLLGQFRKGTITVAGDAMHVMGPFLGQGGSAALEDAVVLARSLARTITADDLSNCGKQILMKKIGAALDEYVRSRRMRLLALTTQTYLTGCLLEARSILVKLIAIFIMFVLFHNTNGHTKFDCGSL